MLDFLKMKMLQNDGADTPDMTVVFLSNLKSECFQGHIRERRTYTLDISYLSLNSIYRGRWILQGTQFG